MKRDEGKILDSELEALWHSGIGPNEFKEILAVIEQAGQREPSPGLLTKILAQAAPVKEDKPRRAHLILRPILGGALASAALAVLVLGLLPREPYTTNGKQAPTDALVSMMLDDEAPFDDIFAPDIVLLEALS